MQSEPGIKFNADLHNIELTEAWDMNQQSQDDELTKIQKCPSQATGRKFLR